MKDNNPSTAYSLRLQKINNDLRNAVREFQAAQPNIEELRNALLKASRILSQAKPRYTRRP